MASKPAKSAKPAKPRAPRRPPAPKVTITVTHGGLSLERTASWSARGLVRREMLAELRVALDEHDVLRPRVDTVPGGTLAYVDDSDWGSGKGRRVGFT